MSIKKIYTDIEVKGYLLAEGISIAGAFTFPTIDGASGQVLTTDGSGNVSWQSLASLSLTTDDVIEGVNLYFTQERAEDTIGSLIQNGTGLSWTYNDIANTLVGNVSLSPFTTTNLAEGVNLYFTNERVDDRVAALIQDSSTVTWSYNDGLGELTASAISIIDVEDNGSPVGSRKTLNFISGPGIILSLSDDGINDRINIDITSSFSTISIFDLSDVISVSPIEDGYVLTYNSGIFEPAPPVIPISFNVSGARQSASTNVYLNQDEVSMFTVPYILPEDCKLTHLSASCQTSGTWTAEVHVNGTLITGAQVTITASTKAYIKFTTPIQFYEGDEVQLYCNGSSIQRPRINATFVAY